MPFPASALLFLSPCPARRFRLSFSTFRLRYCLWPGLTWCFTPPSCTPRSLPVTQQARPPPPLRRPPAPLMRSRCRGPMASSRCRNRSRSFSQSRPRRRESAAGRTPPMSREETATACSRGRPRRCDDKNERYGSVSHAIGRRGEGAGAEAAANVVDTVW